MKLSNSQIIFLLICSPAAVYFFIEWFWRILYIWGEVYGIYWLFWFLDEHYPESMFESAGLGILFLIIGLVFRKKFREKNIFLHISFSMLLLCAIMIFSFPRVLEQNVHLDSVYARGRQYYLSANPHFVDINFFVAECDKFGIFCRTIYGSYDITTQHWMDSYLIYHDQTRILKLKVPEEGGIFKYSVP